MPINSKCAGHPDSRHVVSSGLPVLTATVAIAPTQIEVYLQAPPPTQPVLDNLPVACHCEDVSFAAHLQNARAALSKAEEWQEYFDPNSFAEAASDAVAFDFAEQPAPIENAGL